MGRWSFSNKTEADHLKKIEIWWLKKCGYLDGWKSGGIEWTFGSGDKHSIGIEASTMEEKYVRFRYSQTDYKGEKKEFDYRVELATTPCNYGGVRYWFICPLSRNGVYCGRRVGVLYKDGDYFGCRHCYDLTYSSKNENRHYKLFPMFNILLLDKKIEELNKRIKRPYYAGKPTKKQRRLEKLYKMVETDYQSYFCSNRKKMV